MNHDRDRPIITRISPRARWGDLLLPAPQVQVLRDLSVLAHQNLNAAGNGIGALKRSRDLGIRALFSGNRDGKITAAAVLANELSLDLYRVDLSGVVSTYIAETEENLRRVFDAAEGDGAILFFDQADALFGRRDEIRDAHDRYAGIETGCLPGRIGRYRGLVIVSTEHADDLDPACLHRFLFVVHFPREGMWRGRTRRTMIRKGPDPKRVVCCEPDDGHQIHSFERNDYFSGKLMTARDFQDEQVYLNMKKRLCDSPGNELRQFERNDYFSGKLMTVQDFRDQQKYFSNKKHKKILSYSTVPELGQFERNDYFSGRLMTERDFHNEQKYSHEKYRPICFVPGTVTVTTGIPCITIPDASNVRDMNEIRRLLQTDAISSPRAGTPVEDIVTVTGEPADRSAYARILRLRGFICMRGAGHHYNGLYHIERVSQVMRRGVYQAQVTLIRISAGRYQPDRHFVFDREEGRIIFGDGVHGNVPPQGDDGIHARCRTGGGSTVPGNPPDDAGENS